MMTRYQMAALFCAKHIALLCFLIVFSYTVQAQSFFQNDQVELIETSEESDSEVQQIVRQLATSAQGDPVASQKLAAQVQTMIANGKAISEHDYLWTLYTLLINAGPELNGGMLVQDYVKVADTALHYLDSNTGTGIWTFTDHGQFQIEVYKQAANGAAWALRDTHPKRALGYIEIGLEYMGDGDLWLQDTYVRILLNLNETEQAFAIVKATLEEDPGFSDFQDFATDKQYLDWLKSN